jgi:acyl-CoA reductase-like NAD-dependent aldehyde dehydrogenase
MEVAARNLSKVTLELGGSNSAILDEECDLG